MHSKDLVKTFPAIYYSLLKLGYSSSYRYLTLAYFLDLRFPPFSKLPRGFLAKAIDLLLNWPRSYGFSIVELLPKGRWIQLHYFCQEPGEHPKYGKPHRCPGKESGLWYHLVMEYTRCGCYPSTLHIANGCAPTESWSDTRRTFLELGCCQSPAVVYATIVESFAFSWWSPSFHLYHPWQWDLCHWQRQNQPFAGVFLKCPDKVCYKPFLSEYFGQRSTHHSPNLGTGAIALPDTCYGFWPVFLALWLGGIPNGWSYMMAKLS